MSKNITVRELQERAMYRKVQSEETMDCFLARELADVMICVGSTAEMFGIDLGKAVLDRLNEKREDA